MIRQLNVTTSLTTFYCLRIHAKLAIYPRIVYEPIILKFTTYRWIWLSRGGEYKEGVTYITVFNFPNKPTFELKKIMTIHLVESAYLAESLDYPRTARFSFPCFSPSILQSILSITSSHKNQKKRRGFGQILHRGYFNQF